MVIGSSNGGEYEPLSLYQVAVTDRVRSLKFFGLNRKRMAAVDPQMGAVQEERCQRDLANSARLTMKRSDVLSSSTLWRGIVFVCQSSPCHALMKCIWLILLQAHHDLRGPGC